MIIVHVHVRVRPEHIEAFKQATIANAHASLLEVGIARFDVLQQQNDLTRFVLVEAYRTVQAQAAHKETQHYQTWRDMVAPKVGGEKGSWKFYNLFSKSQD